MTDWETVDVPRGAYISWGNKAGQTVTGKTLNYDPDGGTDFAGKPCPTIEIELTEKAYSVNKEGDRSTFDPGETVVLNAGQVSLKRALRAASPRPGDLVEITLSNMVKTASGGTVKEFGMRINRAAADSRNGDKTGTGWDSPSDNEPPF